jgi:hypothetical protein
VYCERPDRAGETIGEDFWCHGCLVDGRYQAFVEAQMLVQAVLAERARRHLTPRDDKRFKPAETN